MRLMSVLVLFLALIGGASRADGEKAGVFDYYVMALSWSPNWCALEGDARDAEQCETDAGWILHGLWPQYHRGWPAFCPTVERAPSRRMTGEMADIMGSGGLAWHQWKKHGVCSGLSATQYYALSREAYGRITRPEVFRKLDKPVSLPASLVEEAFIKANPTLEPDMITVTCKDSHIQEVRVCLSRDLDPVPCGRDVVRDCTLKDAQFTPIR
ncbi:ribonuclease T2 [Mameliella alba]|nr:ribonuclease T2 [Antarctobacter heliothermus]MBY6144885.1 ribonuclease T2 [Mameliella alba]MBY6160411.1 ribonuclease T2 [Mameliella alba]MBY6168881.1 ribonuclease T2 [Mameliella alba]MBY6173898.1 ribonuclease T2 [Mameliella alba]